MKTEAELNAALEQWKNGFHFPYAAIQPRNEIEFDFCEPDDDAILAGIAWVHDGPDAGIHGLAAWEVGDPDRFWTWDKDSHPILGWDYLRGCLASTRPVQLVATPAEWLQAVGTSVCIIDWKADLRGIFEGVQVNCPTEDIKRRFARAWKWKPKPAPIVPEARDG